MLPELVIDITMPDVLEGRGLSRVQNSSSRRASEFALRTHKRETTAKHFQRGNRQRYHHMARKQSTVRAKRRRYGHGTDLVKTGTSRELAKRQRPQITHRGSYTRGTLVTRYILRLFNFPGKRVISVDGVNIHQMELEAGAIAQSEGTNIIKWWDQRYGERFQRQLDASPKLKKRLTG